MVGLGWAGEIARGEEPPPPKMRRSYGDRVTLYQAPAQAPDPKAEDKAEPAASIRIPDSHIDMGPPSTLMDELAPSTTPDNVLPPRDNRPRDRGRDEKPWSLQKEEPANKPTGWGWLADEIMKTSQPTSQESSADARYPGLRNPFEDPEVDPYASSQGDADAPNQGQAQERKPDGRENQRTSDESGTPVVDTGVSWKPVGLDDRRESWDRPESADRDAGTGLATDSLSGLSFAVPNLLQTDRNQTDEEADRQRRDPAARELASPTDRRAMDQDRSLFRSTASEGDSPSGLSGMGLRPTSVGNGLFTPVGTAASQPVDAFGSLSAAPSFGSMSAVDIQPSLGAPAPVSPALSLPSQAPATPSLGGMGRELDNLPKTMPW